MSIGMKVLIYGGSFDPPHFGHLSLLRAAIRRLGPDRVYLIPTYLPPHKGPPQAPFGKRAAMLRAALKEAGLFSSKVRLSFFERHQGRKTYAYQFLSHFRRTLGPGADLFYLLGGDSLRDFGAWRRPGRILSLARLVCGKRAGVEGSGSGWGALILPGRFPGISSTEIRKRIFLGEEWRREVPSSVAKIIQDSGLYGEKYHSRSSVRLSRERVRHSHAVARRAFQIAERNGKDPWKAATAGLLHDIGRSLSPEEMVLYCRRHRLAAPCLKETALRRPLLLHAYVGSSMAQRLWGIKDRQILKAIESHTLGRNGMSDLEKVLYVADACSEDRKYPGVEALQKLALKDLGAAFKRAARLKLTHVRRSGGWMHPLGEELWKKLTGKR